MKKYKIGILALAALGLGSTGASAATINLDDYAFNVDGVVTNGSAPAGVNLAGFNTTTGLGTISFSTSVAGTRSFLAFFDHEIIEISNTYFNEYGAVNGTQGGNQSWEIDEPEYVFGNIYSNFLAGVLDNSNGIPAGSDPTNDGVEGDDVSMAMGWNFNLLAGETATITLSLSDSMPSGVFYLDQYDPDSDAHVYFSGNLNITGGGNPVPEPATMLLMATGLTGLLGARARKKIKK